MNQGKTSKIFIVIAVLLVVIGVGAAGYVLIKNISVEPVAETTVEDTEPQPVAQKEPDPLLPTISFVDTGFSQQTYTFPAGMDIRVHNQSKKNLEFSSDDHPTHKEHAELNMKTLKPGEAGVFRPAGKGTYHFHDHINSQYSGTLVIQ